MKYINFARYGFMGALVLLGTTACSDDHYDVKSGAASSKTLWENIQSNGATDSLAMIMSRTYVMKNANDKSGKQTLGELLNQAQTFTVWAPKDGTYNASYYLKLLDKRDQLLAQSSDPTSQSNREAWQINYDVANQFVLNHIARFSNESNVGTQKVRLLNAKVSVYEVSHNLFNSVAVDASAGNIVSANGSLHLLNGRSPFAYNIYDYLAANPNFSKVWAALKDPKVDKETFSESGSTQGAMNENGQMVYVDSVYHQTNKILNACGARVKNEDSLYIAVLPSDAAFETAFNSVSSLFKYGSSYAYDWSSERRVFDKTDNNALRVNADSLQSYSAKDMLISSAFFSTSQFPVANQTDSAQVNYYATHADSIKSTNNVTYYNSNPGGVNPIFNGQSPYKASNGYIYAVNSYNVNPAYSIVSKNEIKLQYGFFIATTQNDLTALTTRQGTLVELTPANRNENVKGSVENNMYRRFEASNGNMTVDIILNNIYSTKYKISAIMLPNRTNIANIQYDRTTGQEIEETTTFDCDIIDDVTNRSIGSARNITISNDSIQSYVLFDSFEFPKCYVNLPAGYVSFPRLRFTLSRRNQTRGKTKSLNISKVILEPVRD